MAEMILRELNRITTPVRAAVFDFDGTISTLRCGWEAVMRAQMLDRLRPSGLPAPELTRMVDEYIAESTGIQTVFQMEWLSGKIAELCGGEPVDAWNLKDEYNDGLLQMVNSRLNRLETGEAGAEEFLVPGSREVLEALRDAGIEIYIASGTDDEDVQRESSLLGIRPLAALVKGAPRRQKNCSKEAVIRDLLASGRYTGRELMVVGDGKVEIRLGREAGAVTVGVATLETGFDGSYHPGKLVKLREAGADYLIPDFRPLVECWNA